MIKRKKLFSFFIIVLNLLYTFNLFAQSNLVKVLPRPTNPIMAVNDFANILSPTQKTQLEQKVRNFYDATSNEIIILTLPTLNGFSEDDVRYAYYNQWKIGNKQKDNGVLILLSLEPRKISIEVGKGLEGVLPDGLAGTIIRNDIIPQLKETKYYEAFDQGTTSIIQATKGEYKMDNPNDRRDSGQQGSGISLWQILLLLAVILIVISYFNRGSGGNNGGMLTRRGYRRWGGPTVFDYGPWSGGGGSGGGIFGGGGGSSSGGGFGDFGGFGGGSSGGGGASGDW